MHFKSIKLLDRVTKNEISDGTLSRAFGMDAAKYSEAFTQSGSCHQRGDSGCVRAVHHESDRASQRADGTAVHPGPRGTCYRGCTAQVERAPLN